MNWDDLRIFLAVARTQRMDQAARQISVNPSTVGRRIARLEAELGVRLFEHSRTGYHPTESGYRLLAHAEAVEQSTALAKDEVAGAPGPLSGTIRVSVSESFGTWILPRHVPSLQKAHPGITLDIVASGRFLSATKREVDVAIALARPTRGPVIVRRLTDFHLGLYGSRAYLEAHEPPTMLEHLSSHTLVDYIPDLLNLPDQHLLDEVSHGFRASFRSSSINSQIALITAGVGIGVLPKFIGDQLGELVPVLPGQVQLTRTFWLVVHKDIRNVGRVNAFVRWIGAALREDRHLLM